MEGTWDRSGAEVLVSSVPILIAQLREVIREEQSLMTVLARAYRNCV
jgi:hypothetical protein